MIAMSVIDRLTDVIPRTASGWLRVGPLVAGLVLVLFLVVRFVRHAILRWGLVAALLAVTGGFTVLPVLFDKRVDEQLLGASGAASAQTTTPGAPAPIDGPTSTTQAGPNRLSTGQLRGLGGHSASGGASIYQLHDGSTFVRLEEIVTPHAPAVYVYLAPGADQGDPDGALNLGALKGNVGSQNYMIPAGTDVSKYHSVLLWCRRFSTPIAGAAQI